MSLTCPHCGMRCRCISYLQDHINSHTGERPHKCPTCKKGFKARKTLKVHMISHLPESERPHACFQCDRRYVTPEQLRVHERKHTGEKPYVCGFCDEAYSARNSFNWHMKHKHNDERPFMCSGCGAEFKLLEIANKHVDRCRTHPCAFCDTLYGELQMALDCERGHETSDWMVLTEDQEDNAANPTCNFCYQEFATLTAAQSCEKRHTMTLNIFRFDDSSEYSSD